MRFSFIISSQLSLFVCPWFCICCCVYFSLILAQVRMLANSLWFVLFSGSYHCPSPKDMSSLMKSNHHFVDATTTITKITTTKTTTSNVTSTTTAIMIMTHEDSYLMIGNRYNWCYSITMREQHTNLLVFFRLFVFISRFDTAVSCIVVRPIFFEIILTEHIECYCPMINGWCVLRRITRFFYM